MPIPPAPFLQHHSSRTIPPAPFLQPAAHVDGSDNIAPGGKTLETPTTDLGRMNCPPTKRQRRLNDNGPTAMDFDDPFGDDEEFTQDDLNEIDVIASQAFPRVAHKPVSRPVASSSRENALGFSSSRGTPSREPLVNRPQHSATSILEVQHAELKRKLKEVEEEILVKNGEIRVLRDSLKGAQQEKEAQRQAQMLLEIQRQKEQSDKEKELNKKVQSLQTELQFKEAEFNEMKSKLHSSDKKKTSSLSTHHSPKLQSGVTQLNDRSGSTSSPVAHGFITKEIFDTHLQPKPASGKTGARGDKGSISSKQETCRPDPFMSKRPAPLQFRGGTLLGLLLQQPLSPSTLGLSHLLSMSLTSSGFSAGFLQHSNDAVSGSAGRASLSQLQSLAMNGLNMLSQSQTQVSSSTKNQSSCLGAVLFLPLLDYHLSQLSACLESLCSSSAGGSDSAAMRAIALTNVAPTNEPGRLEGTGLTGFSVDEIGLAALRLLYLLASHSDEVVEAVLSKQSADAEKKDPVVGLCSQTSLLQSLLRLCEGGIGHSMGSQMEKVVLSALRTLCVLIQRAPDSHTNSLRPVLQVMGSGFSTDSGSRMVSECVHVLMSLCDHPELAQQLCSQHDPCVFLKLFQFIRTRADEHSTQPDWAQLDLQVVRLLSRMTIQRSENWLTRQHSSCQCLSEMVQTMVIVFHRQWLDLCGSQQPTSSTGRDPSPPWWRSTAASLLRECLSLLHWLLLHHSSFSESCRPLLHMYDQVVPAVQDMLKRIPDRSESEEVALEEICRSDGDEAEDIDIDAVS